MSNESLEKLVTELDGLIRARYPLIAANTHEKGRVNCKTPKIIPQQICLQ